MEILDDISIYEWESVVEPTYLVESHLNDEYSRNRYFNVFDCGSSFDNFSLDDLD